MIIVVKQAADDQQRNALVEYTLLYMNREVQISGVIVVRNVHYYLIKILLKN